MEPEQQDYKGHHIELRTRDVGELRTFEGAREPGLELLIDDKSVRYGQLSDGSYALHEYAYDWTDNLMDLAKRFIDYRNRADKIGAKPSPVGRSDMGVRKNYRNLTDVERNRFVQALLHVKTTGLVDQFAEIHSRHAFHTIHRSSHFLPWHREMILRFERELQNFHPEVTIPYWDSATDTRPSDPLWANNFLGQFDLAWNLTRALGSDTLPTPQQVEMNQDRDAYDIFWPELESVIHNAPHRWVEGVMGRTDSPGDPVFYLHHSWIDMLWARWQLEHLGTPFVSSGAGVGLNDPLMEWPNRTPADVLDHHALGYTYDFESVGWNGDWFPLPGQAVFDRDKQQIAAVSRAPGNLDLFVIGFDNHVWSTFWSAAGGWNGDWFPLPGQAVFDRDKQQIAAVSRAPGNLDLFVIGFDNHVWSTFWSAAGGWNGDWFPLPGQAVFDRDKQQIAAVSRAPGNLDLFVIGFDNHVWSTFWSAAGGWNRDWFPLPGQAVFDRDKQQIAAVSRAPGNLDLFVIGFDNHVWSTFWSAAGGWNRDWFPLPGQAVFDRDKQQIAAVSRAPGNLDLFVIGFDNHVWSTFWNACRRLEQ